MLCSPRPPLPTSSPYAVGCMFGRYSLDEPGLILGDQGSTLTTTSPRFRQPTFMPDADNVIPIVDGDWFEDDIVQGFRLFLRTVFGEQHFEDNLRFCQQNPRNKESAGLLHQDHRARFRFEVLRRPCPTVQEASDLHCSQAPEAHSTP